MAGSLQEFDHVVLTAGTVAEALQLAKGPKIQPLHPRCAASGQRYSGPQRVNVFERRSKQELSSFRCEFTCLRFVEKGLERGRPLELA